MPELLHLTAAGASLLLDVGDGRLPRVVHWGAELGDGDLAGIARATTEPRVGGELDERHALSVLPEHSWGWMHTPGLSGSRAGRDTFSRFEVTSVERSSEGSGDGSVDRVVTEAADAVAGLALAVTIEMLGTGLVRARAAVTSTGSGSTDAEPYQLEQLTLLLPVPREATELLDFTGRWIRERTPQRGPFNTGVHLRESRRGKPGHDSAFLIAAGTQGFGFRSGEVWLTHVGWSGNSRHLAERANDGSGLIGGGELLLPGEVRLASGETYESPWVYASYSPAGLDTASTRIHRWLRTHPAHPSGRRPVLVNTWEAAYFDHDHDALRALADAAAEVGAERFVLDDGWFRHRRADNAGLGDWFVDEEIYPDGLGWLAEYVRGKGLEFGIWFEPEMINGDSDLARAHPEWIAQPELGGGRWPIQARTQQVLDLTHPEAFAYIEERLHAVIGELQPTYIKWDHNRDLLEAANTHTGRPIGHEQTLAFYRLLDGLHAAFPDLEIESCSGGGARIDLGVLERTQRVWTSDCNDPLERQRMQLWTSLIVPPEYMGAHIGPPVAHTTHRASSLNFRAGTAFWGHLGIEWNVAGPEASAPEVRGAITEWVALHKQYRELLHTGDVVRSDLPVAGRVLQGVVARDQSQALYSFASLDSVVEQPTGLLRLPGLDPARTYRVMPVGPVRLASAGPRATPPWWADAEAGSPVQLTGRALSVHGVQAPGLDPDEVVIIRVEAVQ
ncbi:alpha-galactosidase [Demequina sp.]|uniref:alpha-galactosidase n=1 Tax=Demequina sp. TaxID=2050685 RepID=UPI003D0C88C8